MRVIRRMAYQAHAVPSTGGYARGPFPAEIMAPSEIVYEDADPDMDYSPYATAQNNYQPPPSYRCRMCEAILQEEDLDSHICLLEDDDDGEG